METKTSSTNPMTADDRRSFLQKVTAALGFMPLAGCAKDLDPFRISGPDDPPFEGPPVTLRIASLRPAQPAGGTLALGNYTLEIAFEADVTGVGLRKHSQSFTSSQLQSVGPSTPFDVTDSNIIMLSESGPVLCKCTFTYVAPPNDPDTPPPEMVEETHQKLANEELPWFKLIFVDPGYDIT